MAIERVAVIGAGTMGAGIAQVCAQAGWTTALYDAFPEGLERGMQRIDAFWDKGISSPEKPLQIKKKHGPRISVLKPTKLQSTMRTSSSKLFKIPELKAKVFAQLDEMAPGHAILGTNTSTHCPSQALQQQPTGQTRSLVCISSIQFRSWNCSNWFVMMPAVRRQSLCPSRW